jgi:hypothetical protein
MHLEALLGRGHLFGQPVRFLGMAPNRCYEHAAVLWGKDVARTQLVFGYALAQDGVWRHHGWVVKGGELLETNVPNVERYFGIELSQEKSLDSWCSQFLDRYYQWGTAGTMRCIEMYPQVKAVIMRVQKKQKCKKRRSLHALFSKN